MTAQEAKDLARRWFAEHDCVITARQAQQLGLSYRYVAGQAAAGEWIRVHRGVYRLASVPVTARQTVRIGLAVAGGTAVGSHQTAAWLWDLAPLPDDVIDVTVMDGHPRIPGIRVHRTRLPLAAVTRYGLPCTDVLRTLIDCATVLSPDQLGDMVDRAFAAKHLRLDRLADRLRPNRAARSLGVGILRAALEARGDLGGPTPSVLESRAARLIGRYGLPVPKSEVVVGPTGRVRVDFAYVPERLVLEFNGAVAHASGAQQRHDYQRDNLLTRDGWTVLKFDWFRVRDDPEGVAREIRETYTAAHRRLTRAAASAP